MPAGYAHDVGDGQTAEHQGDGGGALLRRDQVGGHESADAEERAVREGGDDPSGQHDPEVGCGGREQIAHDEQAHQQHQHLLTREARTERGHQRRADDHTQGIDGGRVSGERDGDTEACRHVGQQAHDRELGRSDPKGTDGKRQECERHDGSLH